MASKLKWEYDRHLEYGGKTYHLWTAKVEAKDSLCGEAYDAYHLTHQPPAGSKIDFVKPMDDHHYVGLDGLTKTTGIPV